jgi:hypothetical protein
MTAMATIISSIMMISMMTTGRYQSGFERWTAPRGRRFPMDST